MIIINNDNNNNNSNESNNNKNNQWTITNNNTEPWTVFSVMVVLPLTFFILIFWEEGLTLLRFICQSSGLHQVEKNSWLLQCHKIDKKSGTMSMSFVFVQWWWSYPSLFFIFSFCQSSGLHQVEKISWSSPGGGRACPKITARCWEIVSVGQLLVG